MHLPCILASTNRSECFGGRGNTCWWSNNDNDKKNDSDNDNDDDDDDDDDDESNNDNDNGKLFGKWRVLLIFSEC